MRVEIEDKRAMIGQYIRHQTELTIWLVTDIGKRGVTVDEVEGMYLPSLKGPETLITWPAFARFYSILVQANQVENRH
jgi:hypothetical protein